MFQVCLRSGSVSQVESCCCMEEVAFRGSRRNLLELLANWLEGSPIAPLYRASTECGPGVVKIRLQAHGRLPFAFRLLHIPLPMKRDAELVMSECKIRSEFHGLLQRSDTVFEKPPLNLNLSFKKKCLCVLRGAVQHFVSERGCFVEPMIEDQ